MEVKINKEIKEYNETMFFGLSVRQFMFAVLACGAAVGIYFGCRSFMGTETLSWVCMLGAAPFAALGFIKYNGMTAEKIAKAWIRSEILMPKKILFGGTNKLILNSYLFLTEAALCRGWNRTPSAALTR